MCGRYQVSLELEVTEIREILDEVNRRYAGTEELNRMKTGEVFPTDIAPVLVQDHGIVTPKLLRWGFPQYSGSGVIINARRETLWERPTFRSLMMAKRCIIPACGYYEWQPISGSKKKEKHFIYVAGKPIMMAGLHNVVRDKVGRQHHAYVIITTTASPDIAHIHDRMPLILAPEARQLWLDEGTGREVIDRILADAAPSLQFSRVS